jgi:hypothetical protein
MSNTLSKYMPDAYKRVARTVGYSDADAWHGLTVVLTARLTPQERVATGQTDLTSGNGAALLAEAALLGLGFEVERCSNLARSDFQAGQQ